MLGEEALLDWLGREPNKQPYFAFLNYMEAHQPVITPEHVRQKLMTPREVEESYRKTITLPLSWLYTFGHHTLRPGQLELYRATYDTALRGA